MLLNRLVLILIFAVVILLVMPGSITDVIPQLRSFKTFISVKFSQFFSWGQDLFHKGSVSIKNAISWTMYRVKVTYERVSNTIGVYWNETKIMLDKIIRIHEIISE